MSVQRILLLGFPSLALAACVAILCSQPARFEGHTCDVTQVICSPDGKILASTSEGRTIRLWQVDTRKELAVLPDCTGPMAFSPDGNTLAAVGKANAIGLWDATTGEVQATLQGHTDSIRRVVFSLDGKTLASASSDKTVKLWDVDTGKERATLKGEDFGFGFGCFAFSPDGKTLAWESNRTIKLWDVGTGKARILLRGHSSSVRCLAFSPDGKTLASGSLDETVSLWDVGTGKERCVNAAWLGEDEADYATHLAFSPDGRALAALGTGDRIGVWDVASGKNTVNFGRGLRPLDLSVAGVFQSLGSRELNPRLDSVSFTPNGKLVALGLDGQTVKRWEISVIPLKPAGVLWGVGAALLFLIPAARVWSPFRCPAARTTAACIPASARSTQPEQLAFEVLRCAIGAVLVLLILALARTQR